MKTYTQPRLLDVCAVRTTDSFFPSVGAVTGAASMLARSAAKSSAQEKPCKKLQNLVVSVNEK